MWSLTPARRKFHPLFSAAIYFYPGSFILCVFLENTDTYTQQKCCQHLYFLFLTGFSLEGQCSWRAKAALHGLRTWGGAGARCSLLSNFFPTGCPDTIQGPWTLHPIAGEPLLQFLFCVLGVWPCSWAELEKQTFP